MTTTDPLQALEARLAQDLCWLDLPAPSWVPPREADGTRVLDVAIVGGGMAGAAASAELRLLGIDNQCVIDRAPAGYEGPWVTFARMDTLRSPKQLAAPARPARADVPRVVRSAIRPRRVGRALQDSAHAMDGLPALVPARARPAGAQRHHARRAAPARRRPARARRARQRRSADAARAARGARHRPRRAWRPLRTARRATRAAHALPIRPSRSISRRSRASESAWSARARPRSTTRAPRSKPAPRASTCSSAARTFRASTS